MRVAGLILAGGAGSRLGHVLKANLRIGGEALLARVARSLDACAPLILSAGPHDASRFVPVPGLVPVPDLDTSYGGPLAGVVAAAAFLLAEPDPPGLMVSVAVDSPRLPPDYVTTLLAQLGDAPAAVASYGGNLYPTNAVWRLDALAGLVARVHEGTAPHSLKRFGAEIGARTIAWPQAPAGDPFANINTPDDLAAFSASPGTSS